MTIYIYYPNGGGISHKIEIKYEHGYPLICTITYDYGPDNKRVVHMSLDEWVKKGSFRSSVKLLKDGTDVIPKTLPYEIRTVINP
jgi:hypothetical protein